MGDVVAGSFVAVAGLYAQAKSLLKNVAAEGRSDTDTTSESDAMIFLAEAAEGVEELLKSSPECPRLVGARCALRYEHAKLTAALGDEDVAVLTLSQLLESVRTCTTQPHVVYVALRVVNYLAYLLTKKGNLEASRDLLEEGNDIYDKFRKLAEAPYTGEDLLQESDVVLPGDDTAKRLENLHTSNLQMLAYVHNKLDDLDAFVRCHHAVLCRQLQADDLDGPAWASKVVRLASHFLDEDLFGEARRHLAAATTVLDSCEEHCDAVEALRARAVISWCWVKYALGLFTVSKSSVMKQAFNDKYFHKLWESPFNEPAPRDGEGKCEVDETASADEGKSCSQAVVKDILEEVWGMQYKKTVEKYVEELSEYVKKVCKIEPKARGDGEEEIKKEVDGRERTEQQEISADEAAQGDGDDAKKAAAAGAQEEGKAELADEFRFPGLDTDFLEDTVLATYIETAQQARELFRFAQAHWRQAKGLPGEPQEATLQLSSLCRYLAFFESGVEEQYAAQRMCAEALRASSCGSGAEHLRELVESEVELVRLNLRRICCAPGDAQRKTVALQDLHVRLGLLSSGPLDVAHLSSPDAAAAAPPSNSWPSASPSSL